MSDLEYDFSNANDRYEYMARLFFQNTGMMAPGKDDLLSTTPRETREHEWKLFIEKYYEEAASAHFELNLKNQSK